MHFPAIIQLLSLMGMWLWGTWQIKISALWTLWSDSQILARMLMQHFTTSMPASMTFYSIRLETFSSNMHVEYGVPLNAAPGRKLEITLNGGKKILANFHRDLVQNVGESRDSGYPYPHDRRADKDSYPHDSNNQRIIIKLQLSCVMINVQLMLV